MSRIILVPQYPTRMRYQEWWWYKLPKEFIKAGFNVVTLGDKYFKTYLKSRGHASDFSPINSAIKFETTQIEEYLSLDLKSDDILFWADVSFPGIFGHVLFHKRPKKMYGFCHATSLNTYDYFQKDRLFKFPIETAISQLFNKIFVGSVYHENKLGWNNTEVVYLPLPPFSNFKLNKKYDICSVSRPSPQKIDTYLETSVEGEFGIIKRKSFDTWTEYFNFLSKTKVLLITSHEDTFGYQITDAIINNCIPIARRDFAYPEIISDEYLYSNKRELFNKIEQALKGTLQLPEILCKRDMENFYKNIIEIMKGE